MFNRFTDRARRVVVLAEDESRLAGSSEIGTGHLLAACLAEGEGMAFRALDAIGLTLQQVRDVIRSGDPRPDATGVTRTPFDVHARKTLELAFREALQLGHNYIGTEHVLLGILRGIEGGLWDDGAGAVLKSAALDTSRVRLAIMQALGAVQPAEEIPFPQIPRQYELTRDIPDHELFLVFRDDAHATAFSDWLAEEGYQYFRDWAARR